MLISTFINQQLFCNHYIRQRENCEGSEEKENVIFTHVNFTGGWVLLLPSVIILQVEAVKLLALIPAKARGRSSD